MKRNIYGIISLLLLAVGSSLFFAGCITPPPGPRHRDNRGRRDERQGQPGQRSYIPSEKGSVTIDGVVYSK